MTKILEKKDRKMIKVLEKPYYSKDTDKIYGSVEWRTLASTHEASYVYSVRNGRVIYVDEIAYGEQWEWDLKNLEISRMAILEQITEIALEYEKKVVPLLKRPNIGEMGVELFALRSGFDPKEVQTFDDVANVIYGSEANYDLSYYIIEDVINGAVELDDDQTYWILTDVINDQKYICEQTWYESRV